VRSGGGLCEGGSMCVPLCVCVLFRFFGTNVKSLIRLILGQIFATSSSFGGFSFQVSNGSHCRV